MLLEKNQQPAVAMLFLFPSLRKTSFSSLGIKKPVILMTGFSRSGWQDSNLRPPAPKAGAITGLRYTPKWLSINRFAPRFLIFLSSSTA
jgi:hypothetical protein